MTIHCLAVTGGLLVSAAD